MKKSNSILLFLVGLGSVTQFHFVGSLGLSEFPIFLLAPFLFFVDYRRLKSDGFLPFIWLSILTCVGCIVASYMNETPSIFVIKGLAQPYSIFAVTVVLHRLLRRDFNGLKYYILGAFLSGIISIFIFQQETFTVHRGEAVTGLAATDMVMDYPLFWSSKIRQLLTLPTGMHFLTIPLSYSAIASFLSAIVYLVFSGTSGRAAALAAFASTVLLIIGTKSRHKMIDMGRHIGKLVIISLVAVFAFKISYSVAAKTGVLGYDRKQKYLSQTRMGSSALQMLMSGRMEFFCGVVACLDNPLIGFGPKGEDKDGYVEKYLQKYGAPDDYESYVRSLYAAAQKGYTYRTIPAHSFIGMFWIYYGIFGLLLWIYVLYLFYVYMRRCAHAVPQWYGFIALSIPPMVWDIFFSPYGGRVSGPCLVVCILFAKAVAEGKLRLPYEMEAEARKWE